MRDRAPRAFLDGSLIAIAIGLGCFSPGCSPGSGSSDPEKPKANTRQLKHIEELQKKGATPR